MKNRFSNCLWNSC